jgi:hypothetical protein
MLPAMVARVAQGSRMAVRMLRGLLMVNPDQA